MENEEVQKYRAAIAAVQKYLDDVKESAADAERHLEVPAGTISAIPDDSDFIATVKTYAVIEPMLNDLIMAQAPLPAQKRTVGLRQNPFYVFRDFVTRLNIDGRGSKLELAEAWGLLEKRKINFIKAVTASEIGTHTTLRTCIGLCPIF